MSMQADNWYQAQVFIMLEKSNVANGGYHIPKTILSTRPKQAVTVVNGSNTSVRNQPEAVRRALLVC